AGRRPPSPAAPCSCARSITCTASRRSNSSPPLVPKLRLGTHLRETPFRAPPETVFGVRETEFRGRGSQTGVWEPGGSRLAPASESKGAPLIYDERRPF